MEKQDVQTVDKNSREYLERRMLTSRSNLIVVILFTVINLVLLVVEYDRYLLFSASVPYYLTVLGIVMDYQWGGETYMITALVISAVILAVYLVAWLLSKKRPGWLTFAAVFFTLDTVALVWFSITLLENPLANTLDLIFHLLIVWQLFQGVRSAKKLRELPEEIPVTQEGYRGTTPELD